MPAAGRRKEPTINSDARVQQGDLIVGLLNLLDRNRLALVVLAASLATGARSKASGARMRALGVYGESAAAARWLVRNARIVRHFIESLSFLRRCAGHAGYRALDRARPQRRLATAPRTLPALMSTCTSLLTPVVRGTDRPRLMTLAPRL